MAGQVVVKPYPRELIRRPRVIGRLDSSSGIETTDGHVDLCGIRRRLEGQLRPTVRTKGSGAAVPLDGLGAAE